MFISQLTFWFWTDNVHAIGPYSLYCNSSFFSQTIVRIGCKFTRFSEGKILHSYDFKGEVQSRITIISKERVKISLQIGAKIMKIR